MFKKLLPAVLLLMSFNVQAFLVTDFSGNRVNVRDLAGDGRWMVVMLWQLQCVLCEQQKPTLEAFHEKHKQSKAHVVGLATDGHEYMAEIKQFFDKKPTAFPSHVVFGDVFSDQIFKETGKSFATSPGYLIYSPDGELQQAINGRIDINELVDYIENQF